MAWRDSRDLVERSAWVLPRREWGAFGGPFDVLFQAGDLVATTVGPHTRCASPFPIPAPPELARFTRISLQPPEGIDSCLQWSAVDLFVDDDGVVHGVSLDLWEP